MTAISRNKIHIWIVDASVNAANAASSTDDAIKGEIKSYSKSGGERDVESDPVFGEYVDKEKPVSQVELSFEVVPSLEDADRWDALAYAVDTDGTSAAGSNIYSMSGNPSEKAVYIQATDGTNPKSWGFNNCSVTMFDIEHNADDNQTGNLSLKFSPTDDNDISNFMTGAVTAVNLPAWTALDNN